MEKKIALIFAAGILTATFIFTSTVFSKTIEEEITATPVRTVTPGDEDIISSAALKVLRHIVQARGDIHDKKIDRAIKAVKQARWLIGIIREARPITLVKDRIWVAKKHLSYEDTEEVMPDLIPIYASLDEIEDFVPVEKSRRHIDRAKKNLKQGNREKAKEELKLADEALIYTETDLPLASTEKHVIAAQGYLAQNKPDLAEKELRAAEHGVYFIASVVEAPVTQAKKSLWKAMKNYAAGELTATKNELKKAKTSLEKAVKSGDAKTRTAAKELLKEIETAEGRLDKGGEQIEAHIKNMWERTKALSERGVEMVSMGWQKTGSSSAVKTNIIDIKLHVAYAETYQLTAGEPDKARTEIGKALKYIPKSMPGADDATKTQLIEVEKELKEMKADTYKKDIAVKIVYEDIKAQLRDLIKNQ
ncbi:hypothetical protein BMS3Abin10_00046 [bacterium BMS3Abin10]|nr:hypothetical protein BMS3Abin10_00046 [bacterium BMS3Abin10]GBE37786.1 hypothetical protein BMS3Bbin08_00383 [bacterium BMS3Bbin08]